MSKTTKREAVQPEDRQESGEVLRFPSADDFRSLLDTIARQGSQQMLQAALEAEVGDFLAEHRDRRDAAIAAGKGRPRAERERRGATQRGLVLGVSDLAPT